MANPEKNSAVVLKAEGVSKKFASNLKTSMRYGFRDFIGASLGLNLAAEDLREDEFWAVNNASFELKKGDRLGVLGLNGAGKTTLMKVLSGILAPDAGKVSKQGKVMPLFAFTSGMNPLFSGRENAYLKGAVFGMNRALLDQNMEAIIEFADLEEHIDSPFGTYSSGMKARLAFSVAVHANFDLLIIDEGLAVGDIGFRTKAYKKLDELSNSIATISVAHNPNILARVSNKIMVMDHGKIIHQCSDVGRAIDFYYDHFLSENSPQKNEVKHSGFGKIIKDVALHCHRKEGIPVIKHGDGLKISIQLDTHKLPAKAQVVVHFHDANKEPLAIAESLAKAFAVDPNQGKKVIEVTFESLQFKPGVYSVSAAVNKGEHFEVFEKLNSIEKLQVVGDFRSHAPIQLLPHWKKI